MESNGSKEQAATSAPMEQVREILFGAQLKDMEIRFQRQEERFSQEMNDIRDFFKKRLDSLENFMKSEVAGLLERIRRESEERDAAQQGERKERAEALASEQRERAEALAAEQRERIEALKAEERERQEGAARLSADLAGAVTAFERKLAKLSNTLDAVEREAKSLLMTESGGLNDKIDKKYSDALKALAKTNAQIRSDMVYRAALTGLLAETVGGLSKPWNQEALDSASGSEEAPSEKKSAPAPAEEGQDDLPQAVGMGSADNY